MLGAICGDVLGSTYEWAAVKYDKPRSIPLCRETDDFTDDTALTLAVAEWLLQDIPTLYHDDEALKNALAQRFVQYTLHTFQEGEGELSFGSNFFLWCMQAEKGYAPPYNSCGNGSGMRVSPVGWYFNTMEETLRFAKLSADVTHNHPEGEKGAMAIAAAVYLARKGQSKEEIRLRLFDAFEYDLLLYTVPQLREMCEKSTLCQDTVPMAIVAFLDSTDYVSAVQNAISYGSDSDTIAAMTGAIAEAFYGTIPTHISAFCLGKLPVAQQALVHRFYEALRSR